MGKRGIAFFLSAIFIFCAAAVPAYAGNPQSDGGMVLSDESGQDLSKLTDGSNRTGITYQEGDIVSITGQELAAAFFSFDTPPGKGILTTDSGQQLSYGGNGFLHEYIPLPEGTNSVTMHFSQETILREAAAYAKGQIPRDIQQWEPPCEDADMLVFSTHADDDQLWFGAAIATEVDRGRKVQVVFLTDHVGEPYRRHELLDALWTIGVHSYPITADFPDYYSESIEHAKGLYDVEAMLDWQVEQLRRFRPEVVLGHDLAGEYGHGVHCLNASLLTQAIEQSGDAAYFPGSAEEYGLFDPPKTYLHLYPERQLTLDVEAPLTRFEGKTAFEMAQLGYACHLSQQYAWFKVFKSGSYDCRKFGLYRTLVGEDSGINDLFEHISVFSDDASSSEPEVISSQQEITSSMQDTPVSSTLDTPASSYMKGDAVTDNLLLLILILLLLLLIGGATLILLRQRRKRHETRSRKEKK